MKKLLSNILEIILIFGLSILGSGLYMRYGIDIALIVVGGCVVTLSTALIFIAISEPGATRGGN